MTVSSRRRGRRTGGRHGFRFRATFPAVAGHRLPAGTRPVDSIGLAIGFAVGLIGLMAAGCGDSKFGRVQGRVTKDGSPLAHVVVAFHPEDGGRGASSGTDSDGNYDLWFSSAKRGAPVGGHRVTLEADSPPETGRFTPPSLPRQFKKPDTTPLRHDVRPGWQRIDIEVPAR